MLLINHTQDRYFTVPSVDGIEIQVGPGQTVQVADKTGEGLIHNYSQIFRKMETVGDKATKLEKEKTSLVASLASEQEKLATSNAALSKANEEISNLKDVIEQLNSDNIALKNDKANLGVENKELKEKVAFLTGETPVDTAPKTTVIEVAEVDEELVAATKKYEEKFKKRVPNNKKNNLEWIKEKLAQ